MAEEFGKVAARAHIDCALSTRAHPRTVAVECRDAHCRGTDDWEHVPLFDDLPITCQQLHAATAEAVPCPLAPASNHALTAQREQPLCLIPRCPSPAREMAIDPAAVCPDSAPGPDEARAAALFRRLRRRLARIRRYNRTVRFREAREQAAAVLAAAAAAGCRRIAEWAALMLGRAGYMTAETLDDLELRIDTSEAVWRACRSFV